MVLKVCQYIALATISLMSTIWSQTFETEDMEIVSGNAQVYYDSSVAMFGNAILSFNCSDSGRVEITVRAFQDSAGSESAIIELSAPDNQFSLIHVNSTVWDEYHAEMTCESGIWFVSFINDLYENGLDRNVYIDWIKLEFIQAPDSVQEVAQFCFTWNHSTSLDVETYAIYWGASSRKYSKKQLTGYVTSVCLDSLPCDSILYFSATAIDSAGNESGYSNEIVGIKKGLQGDFNNDGIVDHSDTILMRSYFATSFQGADFNGDGVVDHLDIKYFREECFGTGV